VWQGERPALQAAVKPEFEAIRRNKVHEEVARQLEELIVKNLQPGDKLPPERELVEKLGVSRSSVRDAIRKLELMGLVEPRQGTGTVVRDVSDAVLNPLASIISAKRQLVSELLDFRQMVEPPLAARAASNATAEQIAAMEEILRRHEEKVAGGHLAVKEDSEFHYTIATASGNTIVLKVLDIVMDMLRETRSRSLQTRGRPEKSLAGHRRILSAIKRRDAAGAEDAMRQHISNIEKIVLHKL
jgi:GntR family transcriptional repressor for pyruvate dehydrogenase complex